MGNGASIGRMAPCVAVAVDDLETYDLGPRKSAFFESLNNTETVDRFACA